MKNTMKKLASLLLLAALLCLSVSALAAPSAGNLLHFIPTTITVEAKSVLVEGYFVNLNKDCDIKNLTKVEMDVYKSGDLLISGDFGDINQFTVKSMGTKYQSFTFNGDHELNVGTYDCNDHYYVAFSCSFTTVN